MTYLLDTNVISETIKSTPDKQVIKWLSSIDASEFSLSVLTIGEIRKGIEKLSDRGRKQKILHWLETDVLRQFDGKIINIDPDIANKWGYLTSIRTLPAIDGLIAASAIVHNHKLVTRNIKDFEDLAGLEIINPWES